MKHLKHSIHIWQLPWLESYSAKDDWCSVQQIITLTDMKISQYIRLHIKSFTAQISLYDTFQFFRYSHFNYAKCLFKILQKQ